MRIGLLLVIISISAINIHLYSQTVDLTKARFSTDLDVYIEDVIVAQSENQILGFTRSHRTELRFDRSINVGLKRYFKNHLPYDKYKMPLIIRVNKIYVSGDFTYGITELSVSFITKAGDDYYELLHTGSVSVDVWSSFATNTSRKYGQNVINAFEDCFADLNRRRKNNTLISRFITQDELRQLPTPDSNAFPVFNQPAPVKGVFYAFSDFMDHVVDNEPEFNVHLITKSENIKVNVEFHENKPSDVWAICDGVNYYYNFNNRFYPMFIGHNAISTYIDSQDLRSYAHTGGMIGGLGGMIGSLVGFALFAAIEAANASLVELNLDILTGELIRGSNQQVVLFECMSRKEEDEVCIFYQTEKLACLKRGESFRYKYTAPAGVEEFILQTDSYSRKILFNPQNEQRVVVINKNGIVGVRFGIDETKRIW